MNQQELIDIFSNWYDQDQHSKNRDYYKDKITYEYLSKLTDEELLNFFYEFVGEGGKVQSGGL